MKRKIGKIQYTVRFVALEALVRIERGGAYSNLLLRELMNQGRLNDKDGRLLTEMVYGTISRQLLLDYYLANFIKNAKKSRSMGQIIIASFSLPNAVLGQST